MEAFINGAVSALQKVLDAINIIDPEGTNADLNMLRGQVERMIAAYKASRMSEQMKAKVFPDNLIESEKMATEELPDSHKA